MSNQNMKFKPGTFLEIDDLAGGRKVVMVGRDGVTYWDSIDADKVTPVVIHPVLNPVVLGTVVYFVQSKGLTTAAMKVMEFLRVRMDTRAEDSLFVIRVLWNLVPVASGENWVPDDGAVQLARDKVRVQEANCQRMFDSAAHYNEMGAVNVGVAN